MTKKIIVTAAITGGIHTPSMSTYLPITPQQIADECVRVHEAGGAVAHIHVRNPESGEPSTDLQLFKEIATRVKSKCDIILCFSTSGRVGSSVEQRVKMVTTLKPELASFNIGSLNFGFFPMAKGMEFKLPWEKPYLESTADFIFPNTFKTLREYSLAFEESGTKGELEIYDVGMLNNLNFMLQEGHIKKPIYLQFVLGVLGGIPASPSNLWFLHNTAREVLGEFIWSTCAAGRQQLPMCTMALTMGGNVRVGLEDSLYAGPGILAKSNAEQVEKITRIARELGLELATADETRKILGLKGLDKVNW